MSDYGRVFGFSEDGRYALALRDDDQYACFRVRYDGQNGLQLVAGRWECSFSHLETYAEVYRNRFPVLP